MHSFISKFMNCHADFLSQIKYGKFMVLLMINFREKKESKRKQEKILLKMEVKVVICAHLHKLNSDFKIRLRFISLFGILFSSVDSLK